MVQFNQSRANVNRFDEQAAALTMRNACMHTAGGLTSELHMRFQLFFLAAARLRLRVGVGVGKTHDAYFANASFDRRSPPASDA